MAKKKTETAPETIEATPLEAKVNKSETVREIDKSEPGLSAKEVVARLATMGISATEQTVYAARQGSKKKESKPGARGSKATFSLDDIDAIEDMAEKLGGFDNLIQLAEKLKK